MLGDACRVEPLDLSRHAKSLYESCLGDESGRDWTYLPEGPFGSFNEFNGWLERQSSSEGILIHAIVDSQSGLATGTASYLNIVPKVGTIEVGYILYSPCLQQTRAATESMYLMMRRVFGELGYRRYEWKCDALNTRSRRAALRLGFQFEGIFRQATVYKGRNRDTAWFSIVDREWEYLDRAYQAWLDVENFDAAGHQKRSLSELIDQFRQCSSE